MSHPVAVELDENQMIDEKLVYLLVASQFPQWKDLPVRPVAVQGWDNRTFHLGKQMLVRMPSAAEYAMKVEKEQKWLPRLAPLLPLSIPEPLAMGEPGGGYPWRWSIYRWIEGNTAGSAYIADLCDFATSLAQFLIALQRIDTTDGPLPGPHNFYRGGKLTTYDAETRHAIDALKSKIDVDTVTKIWEEGIATTWQFPSVWVHGDISAGNLLVQEGKLSAVIDFGGLAVGDPACLGGYFLINLLRYLLKLVTHFVEYFEECLLLGIIEVIITFFTSFRIKVLVYL